MKLGVLLDRLDGTPGGAEGHTLALMQRAVDAGEQVVVATISGTAPEPIETLRVAVPGGRPERDAAFARDGARALREAGCDVVFAIRHALDCDVYLPHGGLVDDARAAKDRASGGPSFWTRVGRRFSRKHAFFLEAEQALLGSREGPQVIAVSDMIRARIKARYPAALPRTVTVVNGVDGEHFQREPFEAAGRDMRQVTGIDDALVGLLLAHHPVLKGAETALRALADDRVSALPRPVVLLVVGGRLPARLRRLARRLGVAERVKSPGAVADPRALYAAADLLVHPTWYDPCSLVCLEAFAMGLPVITTPQNGVHELMGRRGGIVIEAPDDHEALATALAVLADDEMRAFTAEDARYLALKNRAATRLDTVLDICRAQAARR